MSYRCHVWKITPDGETELPACPIAHKSVEAALNCRHLRKGDEACHRWEIHGGAFVVDKGEGPRGWSRHGKIQGGVSWEYSQDYIQKTERVTVAVDGQRVLDMSRKSHQLNQRANWGSGFAQGMAYMLAVLGKSPDVAGDWLALISDNLSDADREELPTNVIKGPWGA